MFKKTVNRKYKGIPVGFRVRRDIGRDKIFRIRRGNGYFGAEIGDIIQDKYLYFVPSSINNPQSAQSRLDFAAAVAAWQTKTPAEKNALDATAASRRLNMSGYNLFIRQQMLGTS